jgi:hypothetical protein
MQLTRKQLAMLPPPSLPNDLHVPRNDDRRQSSDRPRGTGHYPLEFVITPT